MVNASTLLGVVLLARHGDRLEFFQDPLTYNPAQTFLTPLGSVQELQLGSFLRSQYLDPRSPTFLNGISYDVANITQLNVRADGGGEGAVILESVYGLLGGLFPPTTDNNITLANGTTIVSPFGGYQYIPVESVEQNLDISLNSFTSCPNFDNHISQFYSSGPFLAEAAIAAPFLQNLQPFLGNRSTNFTNMFNIFDYVNVQSIHNATFFNQLQAALPTANAQAYGFANFHEGGVFSDGSPSGIGNIAIRTIVPSIISSLQGFASGGPVKLMLNEISYKPFISFFNVTQAAASQPLLNGIVDYASAVAIELHTSRNATSEPTVYVRFKNGTTDPTFHDVQIFGQRSLPLSQFVSKLAPIAVNTTQQWCTACNQTSLRGCSVFQ
ncbi:hypothetical protein GSI_09190 [Ganoderma sinense ZZ0214-1]|uniref:Phosphoglycerate mutase-like protein n=1 Tax=Ganoderma sinense ZZ0214-1 TaxID=1077348 RepID=A0A2G8S5V1_9APHY|nr:hypothetical protein GSI_09190 [Ganoderma sinense ZZ0214-1]